MPMYNLLEYSKNYKKITGSLWNYYRDKPQQTTFIGKLEGQDHVATMLFIIEKSEETTFAFL